MAYLTWVVRILLFLVLLGFAVRNLESVHVHGFLGYEWQAPLVLVMLATLVVGVLVGVAGTLRTALALRRREPPIPAEGTAPVIGPVAPSAAPSAGLRAARDLPDDDEGA